MAHEDAPFRHAERPRGKDEICLLEGKDLRTEHAGRVRPAEERGAWGERSSALLSREQLRAAAALVLLAPFVPMLFMGEEWGATTPWRYFTDHEDAALAEAVRKGRAEEFAAFGWAEVPDPQDPATFEASRLDWSEAVGDLLEWHRALIALRPEPDGSFAQASVDGDVLTMAWRDIRVVANLRGEPVSVEGDVLLRSSAVAVLRR
jgi:maltooligosyltrehalose trehalohydrolase